jgi:hypothetical protein
MMTLVRRKNAAKVAKRTFKKGLRWRRVWVSFLGGELGKSGCNKKFLGCNVGTAWVQHMEWLGATWIEAG